MAKSRSHRETLHACEHRVRNWSTDCGHTTKRDGNWVRLTFDQRRLIAGPNGTFPRARNDGRLLSGRNARNSDRGSWLSNIERGQRRWLCGRSWPDSTPYKQRQRRIPPVTRNNCALTPAPAPVPSGRLTGASTCPVTRLLNRMVPCPNVDTLTSTAASVTSSFFMVFYFSRVEF